MPTDSFKNVDSKGNEKNKEDRRICLHSKRLGQEGFVGIKSKMTHEKKDN